MMAHYAFLDKNNVVTEVITGVDENELIDGVTPEEWYATFRGQRCVRTSYNNRIRKQFAGIGYSYIEDADVFVAPKPFPSWHLDEKYDWKSPVPHPNPFGRIHYWDEENQEWHEAHQPIGDTNIVVLGD